MKRLVRPIVLLAHVLAGCASTGSSPPPAASPAGPVTSDAPASPATETEAQASPEDAAENEAIARQVLGDRPGSASKAGAAYQWLTAGSLYWVSVPAGEDVLVAVVSGGKPPVRLTGDIPALKAFLARQFNGRLPGAGALDGVARLVKDAVIGKTGTIAGVRTSLNKNEWTLTFNVTNRRGGIDVVRASGTASPLTLQFISVDTPKG
jgi:hypothetical protein